MLHLAPIYLIAVALAIAYMVRKMVRQGEELDDLRTAPGTTPRLPGQELDRLMRQGAVVFDDSPQLMASTWTTS